MKISPRERTLLAVIGTLVFLFLNLVAFNALRNRLATSDAALASKTKELATLREILTERDLWESRDQWLNAHQPKLENREQAPVALLDYLKQSARTHNVALENPQLGTLESQPTHQAVSVTIDTRSSWDSLIALLHTLQQPEAFIVLESAMLEIDPNDATRMHGRFKIARWYAP